MSSALPAWCSCGTEVRWAFVGPGGPDVLIWSVAPGTGWSATARLERSGEVLAVLPAKVQVQDVVRAPAAGLEPAPCVHLTTPGGELVLVLGPGPCVWYAVTALWKALGIGGGRYEAPVATALTASLHQPS